MIHSYSIRNMTNHLANQNSPYLLQHADNPVDWYPWGEEALKKAAAENKPILLSIGYSACHWCHVMAHESFEDAITAAVMNTLFVNIKVDREERPDLDKIYQSAHQLLTNHPGGWPLTVVLDPHALSPFFAGTYFPKEARFQLPAFKDLLVQIVDFYNKHKQEISAQASSLASTLQQLSLGPPTSAATLNLQAWTLALQQLVEEYDPENGGFGASPKFPNPSHYEFLIRDCSANSKKMLQTSLTKMALGGIYDQIGGGFYRYATDAHWEIPHFEKMLYDNAQLLYQYAQADALMPNPVFKKVITETANWVMRQMQSEAGGYYSALDADSEGKEGWYYVWTPEQIKSVVTAEEFQLLSEHFNLSQRANFDHHWHLNIACSTENIAQQRNQSLTQIIALLDSARAKLLQARTQRIAPGMDDKILTAWNALMIKGMAFAGAHLACSSWLDSAERALSFLHQQLWHEGRLCAAYKNHHSYLPAYLDDYAFLLDAILVFLQYRWRTEYLFFAIELAEVLITYFQDPKHGGFYFVADDHEALMYRPKTLMDNVTPAGSGIACYALQRLGYLLAEPRYLTLVERSLKFASATIEHYPAAHLSLLITLREHLEPPQLIIVRSNAQDQELWQAWAQQHYHPARMVFTIENAEEELPSTLATKVAAASGTIAYVCQGTKCFATATAPEELAQWLQASD